MGPGRPAGGAATGATTGLGRSGGGVPEGRVSGVAGSKGMRGSGGWLEAGSRGMRGSVGWLGAGSRVAGREPSDAVAGAGRFGTAALELDAGASPGAGVVDDSGGRAAAGWAIRAAEVAAGVGVAESVGVAVSVAVGAEAESGSADGAGYVRTGAATWRGRGASIK